jgi:hypothetical protein
MYKSLDTSQPLSCTLSHLHRPNGSTYSTIHAILPFYINHTFDVKEACSMSNDAESSSQALERILKEQLNNLAIEVPEDDLEMMARFRGGGGVRRR